jgi:chromosome segregation ATPase
MPSRDDTIDLGALPSMQADVKSDSVLSSENSRQGSGLQHSSAPAEPIKSKQPSRFSARWLWLCLIVLSLLSSALVYFQLDLKHELRSGAARIDVLEAKLSSTDKSMSQSSVAMQVKLNDLTAKTDQLWGQMDKLWASAWRRNQTDIAEHGQQIASNNQKISTNQTLFSGLESVNVQLKNEMIALQKEAKALRELKSTVEVNLEQQQQAMQVLKSELNSSSQLLSNVDQRSTDNARWIESINAFRQQTNKTLAEFEQNLNISPNSTATQP